MSLEFRQVLQISKVLARARSGVVAARVLVRPVEGVDVAKVQIHRGEREGKNSSGAIGEDQPSGSEVGAWRGGLASSALRPAEYLPGQELPLCLPDIDGVGH